MYGTTKLTIAQQMISPMTTAAKNPTAVCLRLMGRPQLGHDSAFRETCLPQSGHGIRFSSPILIDSFKCHLLPSAGPGLTIACQPTASPRWDHVYRFMLPAPTVPHKEQNLAGYTIAKMRPSGAEPAITSTNSPQIAKSLGNSTGA